MFNSSTYQETNIISKVSARQLDPHFDDVINKVSARQLDPHFDDVINKVSASQLDQHFADSNLQRQLLILLTFF